MSNKTVSTLRASSSTVSSRCNAILARGDGPVLTCFICLEEGVLWNTTCTSNDVSTNAASCTSTATCDEVNSKGADTIVVQKKDLREASGSSTMMTAVMVTAFNVGAEHTSDSDEDDKDDQINHPHCWAEWRDCQKFATLRAQLLSYNRPNPVNCCICKTGFARVENDDGSCCYPFSETTQGQRRLQDELFSIIRRMLTQDSYANGEEEPPLCTPISAALAMLFVLVVGLVDLYLIAVPRAYPGHVLLVTLLLCHIVAVAFFFVLAILQRNQALGMLRMRPEDGDSDSSSIVGDTAVLEEDDDVLPPAPYHCRGNDDTATATGRRGATAVNRATGGLTEILLSIEC
eukprot:Lankesteria_metandrocarpae@DN2448_c0_g1_i1.p1